MVTITGRGSSTAVPSPSAGRVRFARSTVPSDIGISRSLSEITSEYSSARGSQPSAAATGAAPQTTRPATIAMATASRDADGMGDPFRDSLCRDLPEVNDSRRRVLRAAM